MKQQNMSQRSWFSPVTESDLRKVVARIRANGALSIRDIDDDELVEKDHAWASRKPSKRALNLALDRKSVVQGTSVSVRVELGGSRIMAKSTQMRTDRQ